MTHSIRTFGICLWTMAVVLLACTADSRGQDKKSVEKHDQGALHNSLRDVINHGAKIYNDHGDHAGCFRVYEGALITVRPFLAADLQKKIDDAMCKCESLAGFAERAHELRKVLDEIRDRVKPGDAKVDAKGETGQISGRITYQGNPVPGGYFLTLVSAEGKKYSSALRKDGSFTFTTPIPVGEYRIAVELIPEEKGKLPARYASETTSGLSIRVQPGKQLVDLNLVN